jgi:hypothetical protein
MTSVFSSRKHLLISMKICFHLMVAVFVPLTDARDLDESFWLCDLLFADSPPPI